MVFVDCEHTIEERHERRQTVIRNTLALDRAEMIGSQESSRLEGYNDAVSFSVRATDHQLTKKTTKKNKVDIEEGSDRRPR